MIWTLVLTGLLCGGTGFLAGHGLAKKRSAQQGEWAADIAEATAANTAALTTLAEAQSRPVVLDAETRTLLASDTLPGCLDPHMSLQPVCLWDRCLRSGQSSAARAEGCVRLLDDVRIQAWWELCSTEEKGPDWDCIDRALRAKREQD